MIGGRRGQLAYQVGTDCATGDTTSHRLVVPLTLLGVRRVEGVGLEEEEPL